MFTLTTKTGKVIPVPAGAYAAIVAEEEVNESDGMTDYFATSTARRVLIGWRYSRKESFAALRKAAASYGATKHLGPGCDRYTVSVRFTNDVRSASGYYGKGNWSPWHDKHTFWTKADADAFLATAPAIPDQHDGDAVATFEWAVTKESVEHRENYSMGAGNYLKASSRYSHGAKVRSVSWNTTIDAVALHVATGKVAA